MSVFPHRGSIVALHNLPDSLGLEGLHGVVSAVDGNKVTVRVKVGNSVQIVEAPLSSVCLPEDVPTLSPAIPSGVPCGIAESDAQCLPASADDCHDCAASVLPINAECVKSDDYRTGGSMPGVVEQTLAALREEAATLAGDEDDRCRQEALEMLSGFGERVRSHACEPDLSNLDDSDDEAGGEVVHEALRWFQEDCGSPAAWTTMMLR
mmetsp:Transcript_28338/g.73291  ORF Transcript_28338/g.73291 Transcript_28338/m.73291 type:complete len:208 (+) Transcript_28338:13-636(+)